MKIFRFSFFLFIAGYLFAQSGADMPEPNIRDNIKKDIKAETGNKSQNNTSLNDASGLNPSQGKPGKIKSEPDNGNLIKVQAEDVKTQSQNNKSPDKNNDTNDNVNNPTVNPKQESIDTAEKAVAEPEKEESSKNNETGLIVRKPKPAFDGLLDIRDADFKYSRIPGITLKQENNKKEPVVVQKNIFTDEKAETSETGKQKEEKSIIGMEKGATDIFVKILLVCLIIGIIILFKFRSKSRSNKVVRRFPGA